MQSTQTTPETLDVRGLACPTPVLRTKKALQKLNTGELLSVLATDPGAPKDISALCRQTGHELMEDGKAEGEYHFLIRKT